MRRRKFLAAAGVAATASLAGCTQPEPRVTSADAKSQLFGPTKIEVVIENSGPAGRVKAVIETVNGEGVVLQQFTRTVEMDKGERRQVTWTVDLQEEAERFTVTAKPAGYF